MGWGRLAGKRHGGERRDVSIGVWMRHACRVMCMACVVCVRGVWYSRWELPPREEIGSAPAPRPYVPFEGRTTAQDAYVPKVLEDGPTFGTRRETGDGAAPYQRPYIPFVVCVLGVGVCEDDV